MSIYTIAQLREQAPESYRQLPDDILICKYGLDVGAVGGPEKAFDYFGSIDRPILFNCEQLIYLHDLRYPTNAFAIVLTAVAAWFLVFSLYKNAVKKVSKDSLYFLSVKLAVLGGAFSFLLGVTSLFRHNVMTALSILFVWMIFSVPTLFIVGFLYRFLKLNGLSGAKIEVRKMLRRFRKSRDSQEIWLQVSDEIESNKLDRALWAQSLAKAGGDTAKAKGAYMIKRYDQLAADA